MTNISDVFVKAEGLRKSYGRLQAVKGLDFEIKRGEIVGFMGPNGAGKSSTMRMLVGYLRPDEGEIFICGEKMTPDDVKIRKLIGYLPEQGGMYSDINVGEFLSFMANGYKVSRKQLDVVATLTRCKHIFKRPMDTLSKGMRQRVFLTAALLHEPKVLILDEPTDGLDPNQKFEMRMMLKKLAKNKAVIVSTHILEEAEHICDRVILISGGQIVADETPEELAGRTGDIYTSFRKLTGQSFDMKEEG